MFVRDADAGEEMAVVVVVVGGHHRCPSTGRMKVCWILASKHHDPTNSH